MNGDILTPLSIWGKFKINVKPQAELLEERKVGDITVSKIKIDGRTTKKGQVKIYGVIARNADLGVSPAILILPDLNSPLDEKTAIDFAKRGFVALTLDLCGKTDGAKYYTEYPSDVEYANYAEAKDRLYKIDTDATETCWYEWSVVARYSAEYLAEQPCVNSVVGLGINAGAGVLWQAVAGNPVFYATAFMMNAGWRAHRDVYKFGGVTEPQFNDDVLKYVAGIDPQSYASHVKCPCLMLTTTNSTEYDVDRAYDTVSRVSETAYRAVDYLVGGSDRVSDNAVDQISTFFGGFTKRKNAEKSVLPDEPEIKCEIVDGEVEVTAKVDNNNLKSVIVYAAEDTPNASARSWTALTEYKKINADTFKFKYLPYQKSHLVTFFVKVSYINGFSLCSNIIGKRFSDEVVKRSHKEKILYSSRINGGESVFGSVYEEDKQYFWRETDKNRVSVKRGPMSIDGVTSKGGLITFKIGAKKYMPDDYAILMLDLFVKQDSIFTVKLITDYFGNKTEYACSQKVNGGKIWHNLRLEMSRFKTAEGRILKSYQNVNAIVFTVDGEYLINNALWV